MNVQENKRVKQIKLSLFGIEFISFRSKFLHSLKTEITKLISIHKKILYFTFVLFIRNLPMTI